MICKKIFLPHFNQEEKTFQSFISPKTIRFKGYKYHLNHLGKGFMTSSTRTSFYNFQSINHPQIQEQTPRFLKLKALVSHLLPFP
jgi:hypothetical protein